MAARKKATRKARDPHPEEELASLESAFVGADHPPAVVLRGEERYFRDTGVRSVVAAAARAGHELCRHDANDPEFDLPRLLDDLTGGALFATSRCIVVAGADLLLKKAGRRYSAGLQAALLARLAEPDDGVLVLTADNLRADSVVVKAVKKAGGLVLGCRKLWDTPPPWDPDPRRAELVQWLLGKARTRRVQLAPDEAAYVVAATGNDLYALEAQLTRIAERGPSGLRELVGWDGGGSPWVVAEHIVTVDAPRALAGIESLFAGGFQGKDGTRTLDAGGLTAMLARAVVGKLRETARGAAVLAAGGSSAAAAAAAGVKGPMAQRSFEARVALREARAWQTMLDDACTLERRSRTWGTVDASDFFAMTMHWAIRHPASRGRQR
ncbi:MAG: hypothetical protein GY711_02640 [bacterium]|nr:hypothetical protein [bacterium]